MYPFERVASALRADLEEGRLAAGDVLPSEPELARRFSVARMTVRNALTLLEDEGWLVRRKGARTVVARRSERRSLESDLVEIKDLLKQILEKLEGS